MCPAVRRLFRSAIAAKSSSIAGLVLRWPWRGEWRRGGAGELPLRLAQYRGGGRIIKNVSLHAGGRDRRAPHLGRPQPARDRLPTLARCLLIGVAMGHAP